MQLHNLLDQLKTYRDYLSDDRLADQITRLQEALPVADASGGAGRTSRGSKGKLRLDVQPLQRVLREIGEEAREVLLELDDNPDINRLRRLSSSESSHTDELGLDLAEENPVTRRTSRTKANKQTELELF